MRHETVAIQTASGLDWKALGYLVSMASVGLLGAIAWPKPGDPGWHLPVLIAGMVASLLGMAFRYKAHLDELRKIQKTEAEARDAREPSA